MSELIIDFYRLVMSGCREALSELQLKRVPE